MRVHSRLAGSLPVWDVTARFSVTVPPGIMLADDSDSDDCASERLQVIAIKEIANTGELQKTDFCIG